jgi:hypothetical protein
VESGSHCRRSRLDGDELAVGLVDGLAGLVEVPEVQEHLADQLVLVNGNEVRTGSGVATLRITTFRITMLSITVNRLMGVLSLLLSYKCIRKSRKNLPETNATAYFVQPNHKNTSLTKNVFPVA